MSNVSSPNLLLERPSPDTLLIKLSGDIRGQSELLSIGVVRDVLDSTTGAKLLSFESAGVTLGIHASWRLSANVLSCAGHGISNFEMRGFQKAYAGCCGWHRPSRNEPMRVMCPSKPASAKVG